MSEISEAADCRSECEGADTEAPAEAEAQGNPEDDADCPPAAHAADEEDGGDEGEETEIEAAVPEEYAHLLGERPLLWYEDEQQFEEFENAVFAELRPKGMVECIYVRDWVECEWELRRMRKLSRAAIYSSLSTVASDTLAEAKGGLLERIADQSLMMNSVRGSAMGIGEAKSLLKKRAGGQFLRQVDLHLEAHRDALALTDAISREIVRLERRRDQLLRLLEDRRASLAVMARDLIARDEAQIIDADFRAH